MVCGAWARTRGCTCPDPFASAIARRPRDLAPVLANPKAPQTPPPPQFFFTTRSPNPSRCVYYRTRYGHAAEPAGHDGQPDASSTAIQGPPATTTTEERSHGRHLQVLKALRSELIVLSFRKILFTSVYK